MKLLRTILIAGTLILVVVIVILLMITNTATDSSIEPNPERVEFPGSQEVNPIPEDEPEEIVVRQFEETSEEYEVEPVPTSGLVTSVIRQDYSSEFSDVLSTLFIDKYFIDQCIGSSETERALILTAKPNQSLGENQFLATEQAVLDWEANIPRDIGTLVNPSLAQSDLDTVTASFTSYDLYTRYATFSLGNQTHEIYYQWVLNFIVFAPSAECLTASVNELYAPWSH